MLLGKRTLGSIARLGRLYGPELLLALGFPRGRGPVKSVLLDEATAEQLAERFSLHPDSVRVIVRDFARDPDPSQFFVVNQPGRQTAPKRDALIEDIVRLRREGLTLSQIQEHLREQDQPISESYLSRLLAGQGMADALLPRAKRSALPRRAKDGSVIPATGPQKLFRKFVDTTGSVKVEPDQVRVRLDKRAHNPLLKEAGLAGRTLPVPWLGNRRVLLELP